MELPLRTAGRRRQRPIDRSDIRPTVCHRSGATSSILWHICWGGCRLATSRSGLDARIPDVGYREARASIRSSSGRALTSFVSPCICARSRTILCFKFVRVAITTRGCVSTEWIAS
ncbi:hypothetical protein BD309DRAFT_961574, partial [Dichomitus squalens]